MLREVSGELSKNKKDIQSVRKKSDRSYLKNPALKPSQVQKFFRPFGFWSSPDMSRTDSSARRKKIWWFGVARSRNPIRNFHFGRIWEPIIGQAYLKKSIFRVHSVFVRSVFEQVHRCPEQIQQSDEKNLSVWYRAEPKPDAQFSNFTRIWAHNSVTETQDLWAGRIREFGSDQNRTEIRTIQTNRPLPVP